MRTGDLSEVIQALLGHRSSPQLNRYVGVTTEEVLQLMRAAPRAVAREGLPRQRVKLSVDPVAGYVVELQPTDGRGA
jgi:hypothetical protein